ncbi:MAG: hypothetical protein HOB14_08200 [Gammaproteobacteria bacterium]|jgi:hypothetical protein|nr:hypothetical protein [Gammaproteobacteria bacterium]
MDKLQSDINNGKYHNAEIINVLDSIPIVSIENSIFKEFLTTEDKQGHRAFLPRRHEVHEENQIRLR